MTGIIITTPPTVELPPGNSSSNPATLPPVTYVYALLNIPQTWTGKQTFPLGNISLNAADITGTLPFGDMPALTGDITTVAGNVVTTLATVNSNVGSFGTATQVSQFTVNAKGLITSAVNVTITPAIGNVTGLGTGVATALAINVGSAGSPVVNGGALGTPSSGVGTNLTGTAAGLTVGNATLAANVTTNANLTGPVTSAGNATAIANNQITRAMQAQGIARSVIGVTGNAGANVADIQGTTNQVLRVDTAGTSMGFGQINLGSASAITGNLITTNAPTVSAFSAHKNNVDQTGIADATFTQVTFGTEVYDVGSNFASDIWTPPAGKVDIKAAYLASGTWAAGAQLAIAIYKNNAAFKQANWYAGAANAGAAFIACDDIANGTDNYRVMAYLDVTSGTGSLSGTTANTYFMAHWFSP